MDSCRNQEFSILEVLKVILKLGWDWKSYY